MQLTNILFSLYLLSLCAHVSTNTENELGKSIEIAMKCQYREPPKGPVIAVTPLRFTQIVVLLHERFKTPACGKEPDVPISLSDERTWPFCVFGTCMQGQCQCAYHYSGRKCSIYTKKCWLMYCYVTSCHPVHQSLHCICDPSLYGTKVTSGIYWYDEGKSSEFRPPPPGWQDELVGEKISNGNPAAHNSQFSGNQGAPNSMLNQNAFKGSGMNSQSEKIDSHKDTQTGQGRRPQHQKAIASVPGFDSAGRVKYFGTKNKNRANIVGNNPLSKNEGKYLKSDVSGNTKDNAGENADKQAQKSDVEEALGELNEVSVAVKISNNRFVILIFISFAVRYLCAIFST